MDFRHWPAAEREKHSQKKKTSIKRKTFKYFIAIFVHFHSGSRQAKTKQALNIKQVNQLREKNIKANKYSKIVSGCHAVVS